MKTWIALCVLLAAGLAARANASRQVLQFSTCPAGCGASEGGECTYESSGYKCSRCGISGLVVNLETGTCDVPRGKFVSSGAVTDCEKGYYCPGGPYVNADSPIENACPTNMTTRGKRGGSLRSCVNIAGTYYQWNGAEPSAVDCPPDTYGPGYAKQYACVPCPPGYTTSGATACTVSSQCVAPEGFFVRGPGQIAPCPMGEYKAIGGATACTRCAPGVTTASTASGNVSACNILLPGVYAARFGASSEINETQKCPQGFYCPGGLATAALNPAVQPVVVAGTTVVACPAGTWTQNLGSTAVSQCLTPPGYFTVDGVTSECGPGTYRAEWKSASAATACDSCGVGISAEATEQITLYDAAGTASIVSVKASASSCYINAGQGMYYSAAERAFRAFNCSSNSFGVVSKTYGLATTPCRDCPANMVTDNSRAPGATYWSGMGFTSPLACVTKPGYGYHAGASYKCRVGTYNAGNNLNPCTSCGEGLTTADSAAAQVAQSDCLMAPGYGNHSGLIQPCPVGTFNNESRANMETPCIACPTGLTTPTTKSDKAGDCSLCSAGYGGDNCATQCGGANGASYGEYGLDKGTACEPCPAMAVGFSFDFFGSKQLFAPSPVARAGADNAGDCLAEFAQIKDNVWLLAGAATAVGSATAFADCVSDCKNDTGCMFVTFTYTDKVTSAGTCAKKTAATDKNATFAMKTMSYSQSSGTKVAPKAVARKTAKAASMSSGSYTLWVGEDGTGIGAALSTVASPADVQACLSACDVSGDCAGVVLAGVVKAGDVPSSCTLVKGDGETLNTWQRSVTRAVTSKFALPAAA